MDRAQGRGIHMSLRLASILLVFTACADVSSVDDDNQLDAPVGKADAASVPAGSYKLDTTTPGELTGLTLNADHTFSRAEFVTCIKAPCDPIVTTGTWLFTHSSKNRYIHFYDDQGNSLDKFAWKLSGSQLQLNYEGNNHWFALEKDTAQQQSDNSCEAAADCTGFLPNFVKVCSDGTTAGAHWACLENTCQVASCN